MTTRNRPHPIRSVHPNLARAERPGDSKGPSREPDSDALDASTAKTDPSLRIADILRLASAQEA